MTELANLVLADGTVFPGRAFGARALATGEAVFTTGMTGYQEIITDPSYCGQIVTMTAPEIGNVGINADDAEAVDGRPRIAGLVVRSLSPVASNWRSEETLDAYLARHGVPGISEVDTRQLTRHLRDNGAQNAAIGIGDVDALLRAARAAPSMNGLDLVKQVTPKEPYPWTEGRGTWKTGAARPMKHHVVAIDFGTKKNILRCLVDAGCKVTVVPATTSADAILAMKPDGLFLSNGPGDPAAVTYAVDTVRALLGKTPIFGICLGHQLLALAAGARSYKLKFGHRGHNQPCREEGGERCYITSQNHGYAVDADSLPSGWEAWFTNGNDGSNEGIRHRRRPYLSVQFHPEAAPGPVDCARLFDQFVGML
jgi:carbamoyl-phosphate synthase small subunit